MIGLRRPKTDEERAAQTATHSAAAVLRHERRRNKVLLELLKWPNGAEPFMGAPLPVLQALRLRGLVEIRFHLTRAGKRAAEKVAANG